jgi:uncharacterized membrane protein YgcG
MRNPIVAALTAAAAVSLLALAGCNELDPLKRPYMWTDQNVNEKNIAAMAVNPGDLIHGQDSPTRPARQDSEAVDRSWSAKPVPLSGGGGASGSSGSSSGGGGT